MENPKTDQLFYSSAANNFYAKTPSGIYCRNRAKDRWEKLFQGMRPGVIHSLAISQNGQGEKLIASTDYALMQWDVLIEPRSNISLPDPEKMNLFQRLIKLEPGIGEIQKQVIHYANFSNKKPRRWQMASHLKALLPDVGFSRDFSKSNSIDLDRGGTNDPDLYIQGPENIDRGWNFNVGWDLAELLFSSDQTSIDSREKMMVDLRRDILSEAIRIYHERRRLQLEILMTPEEDPLLYYENIIHLDELTSMLDALTNGFMSERLEEIYSKHTDLYGLWQSPNGFSIPGSSV
jgi:hypothetical protein